MLFAKNLAILPRRLQDYARLPYKEYCNNITKDDAALARACLDSNPDSNSKRILCFIGGFCDTIFRAMFNCFKSALREGFCIKDGNGSLLRGFNSMYISFNCYEFLRDFMPRVMDHGYEIYIIAHSWGAKNCLRYCFIDNARINMLITLDCVCRFSIDHRPSNIKIWENIYISNRSLLDMSNIVSLIGGARGRINVADINTALEPPAAHASVCSMLARSSRFILNGSF